MITKKKVPVRTTITILPDGTISIQKLELDEKIVEQIMIKAEG